MESCTEGTICNVTNRVPSNFTKNRYIQVFPGDVYLNISVFSCSLRTAHCGEVASVCLVQFRVLQLQWAITNKYRPLLLLFYVLNLKITPWNNTVGKGIKQRYNDNWICFNTVREFCSRLTFRVQFKQLL